jgi:hypothetical protein
VCRFLDNKNKRFKFSRLNLNIFSVYMSGVSQLVKVIRKKQYLVPDLILKREMKIDEF